MPRGHKRDHIPEYVSVPGGVVFIDVFRGQQPVEFWVKNFAKASINPYAGNHVKRDIVILDDTRQRELYREGPYELRSVVRPLNRLLSEIGQVGLESFLRERQIETAQVGRVTVPVPPPVSFWKEFRPYFELIRFWR